MADYMLAESSVSLLAETVENLRQMLASKSIINISVEFANPGMEFFPHEEEVQKVNILNSPLDKLLSIMSRTLIHSFHQIFLISPARLQEHSSRPLILICGNVTRPGKFSDQVASSHLHVYMRRPCFYLI